MTQPLTLCTPRNGGGTAASRDNVAMQPLLEPSVIERARSGDVGAFNRVVTTYRRRVFGVISRLTGRPDDVEDVAQDVFMRLHRSLPSLRAAALFEPWLYRIVVNTTRDYLRRRQRSGELRMADLDERQEAVAMETAAAGNRGDEERSRNIRDQVNSLLSRIPADDRTLLVLKEVEGLSLEELQHIYGVAPGALKGRLFRARQRTLKLLEAVS